MRRGFLVCFIAVFVLVGSGLAFATPWDFKDALTINVRVYEGSPFSYHHDLTGYVDFANGEYVSEAILRLKLDGTGDLSREFVDYKLDNGNWIYLGEPGGLFTGTTETYKLVDIENYINDDGILNVMISVSNPSRWSTADVDVLKSVVKGKTYMASVPEPATMILMGLGLVGLAGASRKKWLKK